MDLTATRANHFHTHGFFFIPNPFGEMRMREIERIGKANESTWESTDWPDGFNKLACQFLMLGTSILEMVEQPELVALAKCVLECDRVHVGACGIGDASKIIAEDGRLHDPTNAPLRILPGSHKRSRNQVWEELLQLELATGQHDAPPEMAFARHPAEVEVILDPRWTLVWTPSCWHATGVKTAAGPRRAMGWNYFPPGGRKRDVKALQYIFADEWEGWSQERKQLWGLID